MRNITAIVDVNGKIDLTTQFVGYSGEHNAVSLEIGFTSDGLSLYSTADYFRIVIDGFYSDNLYLSQNNTVQYILPQEVMKPPKVNCQLLGYKGDESKLGCILKSQVFSFQVECSEVPFQRIDNGPDYFEEAMHHCTVVADKANEYCSSASQFSESASEFCQLAQSSAKSASIYADVAISNSKEAGVRASEAEKSAIRAERAAELFDDNLANALKENKKSDVVLLDDISPLKHDVRVKVVDADELNSLSVKTWGKNLLPYPYSDTTKTTNGITFTDNGDGGIGISGCTTSYSMFYLCGNGSASGKEEFERFLVDGETYTISLNGKNNIVLFGIIGEVHNKDGSLAYYINSTDKHTFTVDKSKYDYYYLRIFVDKDYIEFSNSIIYPQLELGTVSTEYVPYVEPKTYTANENGMLTVESIYPSMTITAETNTKNLLTSKVIGKPSGWYESNGVYESFGNHYAPLTLEGSYLEAGKEYVISIKVISFTLNRNPEPYHSYCACLNYTDSNGKKYESDKIQMDAKGVLSISFTPTVSAKYNLFVFGRDSSEGSVAFSNPKVTLAGAKIECKYNRDINKAFAELRQAIISLGGNL